jgi:hypothetical protein
MRKWLSTLLVVSGCSGSAMHDPRYIQGFDPPPPPEGYTRFITPQHLQVNPGDNENFCEWVAPPFDTDQDIVSSMGYQTVTGHHLSLYGTTNTSEPIGTSRPCTSDDMLTIQFVGSVGGEGVTTDVTKLPPGTAFRLPKGKALMANTHYLNATGMTVQAQSVIDVKFVDASSSITPLGAFTLHADGFTIPNNGSPFSYEATCVAQQDFPIVMACNHMHDHGVSMLTEFISPAGVHTTIAQDVMWSPDQGFNPKWTRWDTSAPLVVHQGDTVHTVCTWQNSSDHPMAFPEEMCDGATYWLNGVDAIYCRGG